MGLETYTLGNLQMLRGMLKRLVRDGVETTATGLELLDQMVADQHQHLTQAPIKVVSTVEICPQCGKGVVTLWPGSSIQVGAPVYGCKQCQWSEIRHG